MSNLIKYPFVNMQGKKAVVVGSEKEDKFVALRKNSKVIVRPADEVEAENKLAKKNLAEKKKAQMAQKLMAEREEKKSAEFTESVPVVNMDKIIAEKEEKAQEQAAKILQDAREQADMIVTQADHQAEQIRESAREEGMRQGLGQGIAQAEEEMQAREREFEELKADHEREYRQALEDVEPRYVEILCELIHRITGVLVEDRKDVFLYLIRSSMEEIEPSGRCVVRVSPEDIIYVESHKEDLISQLGSHITLEIQEEKGLEKNDCIIETDTQMIDCGLHTQLENLESTLKMLL